MEAVCVHFSMNHDQFAHRIVERLNEGVDHLPPGIEQRLSRARQTALARQARPSPSVLSSGAAQLSLGWRSSPWTRPALAIFALLLALSALFGLQYQRALDAAQQAADIDADILGDETPLQSYADPAFSLVVRFGLLPNHGSASD